MKKHIGLIGLLVVAVIWGSGFVATEIALRSLSPLKIIFIRFFISTIIMLIVSRNKLKEINKKLIKDSFILGFFLCAAFALQTFGLQHTTPSKNAFLTATNVVIVPFIAFVIYKKKMDKYSIMGSLLAIIGIWLLSMKGDYNIGLGDILTLLCAICFAFQIFLTGEYVKSHDYILLMTLQMAVATILGLMLLLSVDTVSISADRSGLISVAYLGIFSTCIAFFLQTWSQRYTDETKSAIILSMESIFGTIFSMIIIGETLSGRMVGGCILILAGVMISETKLRFVKIFDVNI